jgi:hypothetical protein
VIRERRVLVSVRPSYGLCSNAQSLRSACRLQCERAWTKVDHSQWPELAIPKPIRGYVQYTASQPKKQRETPNERREIDTRQRRACGVKSTTMRSLWVLSDETLIERVQRPNADASRWVFKVSTAKGGEPLTFKAKRDVI